MFYAIIHLRIQRTITVAAANTQNHTNNFETQKGDTAGRAGKSEVPDQKSRGKTRGRKREVKHDKQRATIKITQ